jgi:pimeloyl-ACP methyl ester carboxylesterase
MKFSWLLPGAMLLGTTLSALAQATAFTPCKDSHSFSELNVSLCATFHTPLSAPGPHTGNVTNTVDLFVRKFPAPGHPKGTLWLISGGPGESGATFYPFLKTLREAFPEMDHLIPDHRGTGFSTRLCPKEEAVDSPGGAALTGAEWGTCWAVLNADPDYARAFSITNAAHDLAEMIAQYHSDIPTYIYGVSYGTQLVSRMLLFPHKHLGGVILDSLVAPDASPTWDLSHRSQIADAVGRKVLKQCDAEPACRGLFDTTVEKAYAKLLASPPPSVLEQVPGKDLKEFFCGLLDFPSARVRIPELIAGLNRGDTTELQAVKVSLNKIGATLEQYPQAPPSIPLVAIISDSENDARPSMTKEDVRRNRRVCCSRRASQGC